MRNFLYYSLCLSAFVAKPCTHLSLHRRPHFPKILIIENDQCYNNGSITNKRCEIQRFVKYQKSDGKIEQWIEVHQNSNGPGIDLVEGIQVQEQRQHREQAGDHNNNAIKLSCNGDFIHQLAEEDSKDHKRENNLDAQ